MIPPKPIKKSLKTGIWSIGETQVCQPWARRFAKMQLPSSQEGPGDRYQHLKKKKYSLHLESFAIRIFSTVKTSSLTQCTMTSVISTLHHDKNQEEKSVS